MDNTTRKTAALRTGLYVFIGLAILTIVEFFVSISFNSTTVLFIIALIKAYLIVNFFMHIYRLWREDAH